MTLNPLLDPSLTHSAAIAALATARLATLGAGLHVYLDVVPVDPVFPYAVFWTGAASPLAEAERLAGWGGELRTTTQATIAGLSRADVLGGYDRLVRSLHRQFPTITGRVCGDLDAGGDPGPVVVDPTPALGGHQVFTMPAFFVLISCPTN